MADGTSIGVGSCEHGCGLLHWDAPTFDTSDPAYAQSGGCGGGGYGGGGYGGGGSTGGSDSTGGSGSGYPTPGGWNALIRPGAQPSGQAGDYDWTGLNFILEWTDYKGVQWVGNNTDPGYGGIGIATKSVGKPGGYASSDLMSKGQSTYKWLWTPPTLSPSGPPTFSLSGTEAAAAQAPQPLSILEKVTGEVIAGYGDTPNAEEGLGGYGFLNDSFGSHDTFNLPGQAPSDSSTMPRRKLVQASPPDSTKPQNTQVILSPTFEVHLSGGMAEGISDSSGVIHGGGEAGGEGGVNEEAHAVLLTEPNPLGHPELGDGTNQYVYDTQSFFDGQNFITGTLTIPAQGSITGQNATSDDANWLVGGTGSSSPGYVSWQLLLPIANPQPYTTTASGTGFGVQRSGTVPNSFYSQPYPFGSMGFTNMTNLNGNFGFHQLNLQVNGATAGTANFQTFFPASASNHPVDNTDNAFGGGLTPNWYHYYNQVYTATGNYDPASGASFTKPDSPFDIHITDLAYDNGSAYTVRVFHHKTGETVKLAGVLMCPGIFHYIWTCSHEKGHQNVDKARNIYVNGNGVDSDGDRIDDSWEIAHNLDPGAQDTTHAYNFDGNGNPNAETDVGDREYLADVQTLVPILNSRPLWNQDWADKGVQFGPLNNVNFSVPDENGKLDFSFTFRPFEYNRQGTPVLSTTVAPFQVKTLDELKAKANDPDILTSY